MFPCLISRIHCRRRFSVFHRVLICGFFILSRQLVCFVVFRVHRRYSATHACLLVSVSRQVEGAERSPKSQSHVN